MKYFQMKKLVSIVLILTIALACTTRISAQEEIEWASYFQSIPTKSYEGLPFRMSASVKTAIVDSVAAARLWVRIEKKSGVAFFENMYNNPIQNNHWKTYSIHGIIDKKAIEFRFGVLCFWDGKFYFDNFKVEVETSKDNWTTIYAENFENDAKVWTQNTRLRKTGTNLFFNATIAEDSTDNHQKCLVIEGNNPFLEK